MEEQNQDLELEDDNVYKEVIILIMRVARKSERICIEEPK